MLGKLLSPIFKPFTTATAGGVNTRYLTLIATTVLTFIGVLKWLSPEQIEELKGLLPQFVEAIAAAIGLAVYAYGVLTKSSSDKAAEAAKEIDAKLAPAEKVEIVTPGTGANIVIPGKPN